MASWHFTEHDGFGDITQSSSAEAFEGTSTAGIATDLVREGLQNVLDAQSDKTRPARARFTIATLAADAASPWFARLSDHLRQPDVGAPEAPNLKDACRYLLVEDFNTTGLTGDFAAPYEPGTINNFVNFLYHDGLTGKGEKKLGSRGVGKIVFLIASRARAIFAYTRRHDEPAGTAYLVGKSLLKFRKVAGKRYLGASYYVEAWPSDGPREPVRDPVLLGKFRAAFGLARDGEPGLSVVVPHVDENVTPDALRRAVVEEYHFAILSGRLVVELSDGTRVETIDSARLPDVDEEISAQVRLASFAVAHPSPAHATLTPTPGDVQKLSDSLVPPETRVALIEALSRHEPIGIRCLLHIHPKQGLPVPTHFDVFVEHVDDLHQRPTFIRELLPISGVGRPCAQLRSLVRVPPGPLADFLRAAEGANHTTWSPRTDKFKERYHGRLGEIDFVSSAVNRLIEIVRGNALEPVGGISTAFFSARKPDEPTKAKSKGKAKPGPRPEEPEPPEDDVEATGYLFAEEEGGFTIRGDPTKTRPARITVRVAYDVIRGSPWADFDPDDFDLRRVRSGDIRVIAGGADVERPDPGNRLVIRPAADDFEVVVSGFNPMLDLVVDHRNASPAPAQKEDDDARPTP